MKDDFYLGKRLSYDGYLCTIRYYGPLTDTKGKWLGLEWDDTSRGKHNGSHLGQRVFKCLSNHIAPASFLRPTRKYDRERTVLEAIRFKYATDEDKISGSNDNGVVTISGKVAEEIGFEKIVRQQSQLNELKIAILEDLVVCGLISQDSGRTHVIEAQRELETTCPNITELDIGWNPIETWQNVADICLSLPKLRVLRANGLRLRTVRWLEQNGRRPFVNVKELQLDECLISLDDLAEILLRQSQMPVLKTLSLSKNGFETLQPMSLSQWKQFSSVQTLLLENNKLDSLKDLSAVFNAFPNVLTLSLQGNSISSINLSSETSTFVRLESLDLSHNRIDSWAFVDDLPRIFPNLSSLRTSNNPLYEQSELANIPHGKASERFYYLTLARVPKLINLNYTKISLRDREEGELYYLSVVENQINDSISNYSLGRLSPKGTLTNEIESAYPQYERLCLIHHRESAVKKWFSENSTSDMSLQNASREKRLESNYPRGSLGNRLIDATFYLQHNPEESFRRLVPRTLQVNTIKAMLLRRFPEQLRSLQFRLVYESQELDPVDLTTESSSRSQMYGKTSSGPSSSREEQWREWGDWDADSIMEAAMSATENAKIPKPDPILGDEEIERLNEAGVLIKEGRKWKRREVEISGGMRNWGDSIEIGIEEAQIRIEPYHDLKNPHT